MSVVDICGPRVTGEIRVENSGGISPEAVADIWTPARINPEDYSSCAMPDDRLSALGVRPAVATGIVTAAYSGAEALRPPLAKRVKDCLGFLSAEGCIVGPWAAPILQGLGMDGRQIPVPSQAAFDQHRKTSWAAMERLQAASDAF